MWLVDTVASGRGCWRDLVIVTLGFAWVPDVAFVGVWCGWWCVVVGGSVLGFVARWCWCSAVWWVCAASAGVCTLGCGCGVYGVDWFGLWSAVV